MQSYEKGEKKLDVDFIGGVGPLTKEEEKRISTSLKVLGLKKELIKLQEGNLRPGKK